MIDHDRIRLLEQRYCSIYHWSIRHTPARILFFKLKIDLIYEGIIYIILSYEESGSTTWKNITSRARFVFTNTINFHWTFYSECVGECVDDDSAGRSRNQSSSLDSSIDRDILDGRSISPLEQISTTPEMTPDRIPSVSPTPPQVPKTADQSKSRTNRWYYDGFHPMKPSLKRKLRRRKLSKELDQLVDGLDIDEEPPPSKMALSRTRFKERK